MQYRKEKLVNDHYYHIFSRSIAGFEIFNDSRDYSRMKDIIKLYQFTDFKHKYSKYIELEYITQQRILESLEKSNQRLVTLVAYCLMPTHIHLILKQVGDGGISKFMGLILNSYSRYFNVKHSRIGPLWSGRFKSVLVKNDEQLLHLTRYLHLNPTSANLTKNPKDWAHSSYSQFIGLTKSNQVKCYYKELIDVSPKQYEKFVNDRKDYQKQLSQIKSLLVDNYTG